MRQNQYRKWRPLNQPARKSRLPYTDRKTASTRRGKNFRKSSLIKGAQSRLKQFRQASVLTIALTGFLMLLITSPEGGYSQDTIPTEISNNEISNPHAPGEEADAVSGNGSDNEQATDEAINALQNLWNNFIYNYPKILIALGCLFLAWLLSKLIRLILRHTLKRVSSSEGIITIFVISIWLLAVGVAFSVVAGDIRALVGSFGLIGLALSWALQTPIESFTGWLLNSFRGYYRVGDRIRVGEVFGDVYKIDFLATTVWEIGSPYQLGYVGAEQPTGRLVTFPNNEILTGTVINLTGDFPFVWDEVVMAVANESDIRMAMKVMEKTAMDVIGEYMIKPASEYSRILKKAKLTEHVPEKPQVFVSPAESGTEVIIRYLVGARERRKWKTELLLRITDEINKIEYRNKILPVYPRQQLQFIDPDGVSVRIHPGDEEQ
ncbi:MAG: mechanosensitive ion channel [Cyclobacteriaceae bacterium]|nr:mechanosensitive ion channel [Cyclobacteriaceae bacterium]